MADERHLVGLERYGLVTDDVFNVEGGIEANKAACKQIFSEVVAVVSENVLQVIPPSNALFYEALCLDADVEWTNKDDADVRLCTIRGNLEQILCVQQRLEKYLSNGGEVTRQSIDYDANSKCDKGVMCDIIKLDRLSHFALEHPRRARFSSLLIRQPCSSSSSSAKTFSAIKAKYTNSRSKAIRKRRKVIVRTTTRDDRVSTAECNDTSNGQQSLETNDDEKATDVCANVDVSDEDGLKSNNRQRSFDLQQEVSEEENGDEEENDEESRKKNRRNYEELTPFKFFCKQCSFKTKRKSHYMKHLLIHDKVKTLYNCDNCSFATIRLSHLRRHEMAHSQTTYDCEQCAYKTDEIKLLHRHIKLKHKRERGDPPSPVDIHQCSQCPYKTTKLYHFKRHLKVHDAESKSSCRVYRCDQCNYKTNRKEHYIRHVNNVHSNTRPYLCDFCGKAFKRPDALKQHRLTHGGSDSRLGQFKCGVCQKKCRSQAHLSEHQTVHSNIRSFLCEICGASFKTRSVQRKHVLTIHKNPRSHSCEHCLKRFNTNYALRRHVRLHDDNVGHTLLHHDSSTSNILIATPPSPSNILNESLHIPCSPIPFADGNVTSTLSFRLHPHVPSSSSLAALASTNLTLTSVEGSPVKNDATSDVVDDSSALVTINETADILQQVPQAFIQTEASTALLYLTTNFTPL